MTDVFLKESVTSSADLDMVLFTFGKHRVLVPYQTAFEILAGVKLAGKLASRVDGLDPQRWRELARVNPSSRKLTPARRYRRSNKRSNVKSWSVKFDGPLVVMVFNELTVKLHYSDALTWYTGARLAGREAQAWAGDTKRQMRAVGFLNDAAENDRLGYG
jgi:hypothetical protein